MLLRLVRSQLALQLEAAGGSARALLLRVLSSSAVSPTFTVPVLLAPVVLVTGAWS